MFANRSFVLAVAVLAGLTGLAQADLLHDNGPFITHPGGHGNGSDVSQLQNSAVPTGMGHSILGSGVGQFQDGTSHIRLADDFTVPNNQVWTLTQMRVYGYQTNLGPQVHAGATLRIYSSNPSTGGVVIWGDTSTNLLASSTFRGYRIAQTTNAGPPFTDTLRAVMEDRLSLPSLQLGAGTYWAEWGITGFNQNAAVFTPPRTILWQAMTDQGASQALQLNVIAGTWTALTHGNGDRYDTPFMLEGGIAYVPEPSSLGLVGLAVVLGGFCLRRRFAR